MMGMKKRVASRKLGGTGIATWKAKWLYSSRHVTAATRSRTPSYHKMLNFEQIIWPDIDFSTLSCLCV